MSPYTSLMELHVQSDLPKDQTHPPLPFSSCSFNPHPGPDGGVFRQRGLKGEVKVAVLVERPDGGPALTSGRILVIEAFCRNIGPGWAAVAIGTQTASGLENWGPTRSVGGYYHHALRSPEILTLVATQTRARSDVLPSVR